MTSIDCLDVLKTPFGAADAITVWAKITRRSLTRFLAELGSTAHGLESPLTVVLDEQQILPSGSTVFKG
jgi:hypothetical protein